MAIDRQAIYYRDREMQDREGVAECNIVCGAVLRVEEKIGREEEEREEEEEVVVVVKEREEEQGEGDREQEEDTGGEERVEEVRVEEAREEGRDMIHIFVRMLNNRTVSLAISPSSTIEQIKLSIYDIEGLPPSQQRLIYSNRTLEDPYTLLYYNIHDQSNLSLSMHLRGGMLLHIRTLRGESFTIEAGTQDVWMVKERMVDRVGRSPDDLRLIYRGTTMDNDRTLADYNVQSDVTLHLLYRIN